MAGRLVDTNVEKVPRLAEIVLPDLAITGTPTETFAVKVVGYGAGSRCSARCCGPPWAPSASISSFEVPALGVLVLGAAGAVTPFVDLHKAAERRRRHFCHSLSTYASLVSMAMAGAMGWSSALEVAAACLDRLGHGRDRPVAAVGPGLSQAALGRASSVSPLRFNLPDLTDLARAMSQAGDGARIRDSLEAKAQSLRLKETSALEDAAQAVTQKMLLPGVLLMAGYGVLVFYPALAAFTGSHL